MKTSVGGKVSVGLWVGTHGGGDIALVTYVGRRDSVIVSSADVHDTVQTLRQLPDGEWWDTTKVFSVIDVGQYDFVLVSFVDFRDWCFMTWFSGCEKSAYCSRLVMMLH